MSSRRKPAERTELKDRVAELIRRYYEGNVLAASRAMGAHPDGSARMPPTTLERIAKGTTPNPRASALQAIAKHFGATTDWLLSGTGESPWERTFRESQGIPPDVEAPGSLQLFAAVDRVAPGDPDVLRAMIHVCRATGTAIKGLGRDASKVTDRAHTREDHWLTGLANEMFDRSARDWAEIVSKLSDRYGGEAVAGALRKNFLWLAFGFHPFVIWAARRGHVIQEQNVHELMATYSDEVARAAVVE